MTVALVVVAVVTAVFEGVTVADAAIVVGCAVVVVVVVGKGVLAFAMP